MVSRTMALQTWGGRQVDRHHKIGAREESFVDCAGEIAGGKEEKLRIFRRKLVELCQNGVGGAVHVYRVGFHAHLAAVGGERLDLVEEHDAGACRGLLGEYCAEKMRRACGSISMKVSAPFRDAAAREARPRASEVLPVPAGPMNRMMPCRGRWTCCKRGRAVKFSTAWART